MEPFKETLARARHKRGLQQKDLAERLDVVPGYVSRMEKGFSRPGEDLIRRLCEVLDLVPELVLCQVKAETTNYPWVAEFYRESYERMERETTEGAPLFGAECALPSGSLS